MNPAKLVALIMLISLMMGAGLEVNREHLAAVLRDVRLLGRAFVANFVIVPIVGVFFVRAFRLESDVATGVLLMAIAPGVPFVLAGARKKGGRLGLAVTLALVFPLLSILTVPITAAFVLPPGEQAELPLKQFVVTLLAFQLLPLVIGVVLAHRVPVLASKLETPLKVVFIASVLAIFILLGPRLAESIGSVYGSRGMIASLCIVVVSVVTGWLLGGPEVPERRTLSIGTALRNIGLCSLVATVSFSGEPRVAAAVLAYLLIQFVVTVALGTYYTRTAKKAAA
jgi:bile acid:Na+ symporter, BASS family